MTIPTSDDELFATLRETGDAAARNALVERHLPLARNLARRYSYTPQPMEDLVQIASLALVKAVDGFDPARGSSFVAFAVPTIVGELKHSMRDSAWAVHVPRRLQDGVLAVQRAERTIAARAGGSPTVEEVALEAGLSPEEVLEAYTVRLARDAVPLDKEPDGGVEDRALGAVDDRLSLSSALRRVPLREREILRLRFGEGLTQSEIAGRLGLSQVYVSRLLRATLDALRDELE
jgi:RNA polymerase sigma-B factor